MWDEITIRICVPSRVFIRINIIFILTSQYIQVNSYNTINASLSLSALLLTTCLHLKLLVRFLVSLSSLCLLCLNSDIVGPWSLLSNQDCVVAIGLGRFLFGWWFATLWIVMVLLPRDLLPCITRSILLKLKLKLIHLGRLLLRLHLGLLLLFNLTSNCDVAMRLGWLVCIRHTLSFWHRYLPIDETQTCWTSKRKVHLLFLRLHCWPPLPFGLLRGRLLLSGLDVLRDLPCRLHVAFLLEPVCYLSHLVHGHCLAKKLEYVLSILKKLDDLVLFNFSPEVHKWRTVTVRSCPTTWLLYAWFRPFTVIVTSQCSLQFAGVVSPIIV